MCVGDLAVVIAVEPRDATVLVDVSGKRRTVSSALQPDVVVGARVVIHTGFVVEVLDGSASEVAATQPGVETDPGGRT